VGAALGLPFIFLGYILWPSDILGLDPLRPSFTFSYNWRDRTSSIFKTKMLTFNLLFERLKRFDARWHDYIKF
jgi:hypothetical protein